MSFGIDKSGTGTLTAGQNELCDEFNKICAEVTPAFMRWSLEQSDDSASAFRDVFDRLKRQYQKLPVSVQGVGEPALSTLFAAKSLLDKIERPTQVAVSAPAPPPVDRAATELVRLRKDLPKFDGGRDNYAGFIFDFKRKIDSNVLISDSDKKELLFDSLLSPFKLRFIAGLQDGCKYSEALASLKKEFEDERLLRSQILTKMKAVKPLPKEPSASQMDDMLNRLLEIQALCLSKTSIEATIEITFVQAATEKLPYFLQRKVAQCSTMAEFVSVFKTQVAKAPAVVGLPSGRDVVPQGTVCFYCDKRDDHKSHFCQATTREQKIARLNSKRACHQCRGVHQGVCMRGWTCRKCGGAHLTEICAGTSSARRPTGNRAVNLGANVVASMDGESAAPEEVLGN